VALSNIFTHKKTLRKRNTVKKINRDSKKNILGKGRKKKKENKKIYFCIPVLT
jgi:hypothetical protein